MEHPIRIMLVEDHPDYREAVEFALGKEPDMVLACQYGTSERALRSQKASKSSDHPDVILLDLNLPGMSGLDAIPLLREAMPETKIIILTQSDREADVLTAISLGASGYLLKSSTLKQITEGIRIVYDGGASLDANVASFILKTLKNKLPISGKTPSLTGREMEVLSLLAEGYVKKEIASQLSISSTTVVTHVSHIYEKLNVTNAPAAINEAYRQGIFPSDKSV